MSELVSVSNRVQVPSATPDDYVVPPPIIPPIGEAWTLSTRDFESGTLGDFASGSDGFTKIQYYALYANDQFHTGGQSCQCNLQVGGHKWGGILTFPSGVYEGGKVYLEFYNYIPDWFLMNMAAMPSMKYIVFDEYDVTNVNNFPRLHLQSRNGSDDVGLRWIKEGNSMSYRNYPLTGDLQPIKRNVWQKHNIEIGVGYTPADEDGNGYIKHWIDDRLILNERGYRTIIRPDDYYYAFKFLDFYNDTLTEATAECSPYSRRMWIDNITLSAD